VRNGAAQIDQRSAFRAPREDNAAEGTPDTAVPTGLLTLDPHRLASPTNRVAATVAARAAPRPPSTSAACAPPAPGPSGSPPTAAPPCCPSRPATSRPGSC
jgi:hypothetical protein